MKRTPQTKITGALEDYLETIYLLQKLAPVVRVKDIAKKYNVKPGSVSPAMKRLAEAGLIQYQQREYIQLTKEGEKIASKIYSKHEILYKFLTDVLNISDKTAFNDACQIEHSLSTESFSKLSKFMYEYKKTKQ